MMKKLFKKSVACLLAVLMVIAVMPFAVYAQPTSDSTEKTYVKNNIASFNGYTGNASAAADDSYKKTSLLTSETDGVADKMSNVLYAAGTTDAPYNSTKTQVVCYSGIATGYVYGGMQYGNIVFLYDGTNDCATVVMSYQSTNSSQGGMSSLLPVSDDFSVPSNWHSSGDKGQKTYSSTSKVYGIVNSKTASFGSVGADDGDNYYFYNTLYYTGTPTNTITKFSDLTWEMKIYTSNKYSGSTGQVSFGNSNTTNGTTDIYVVNYKPIADKIADMKSVYNTIQATGEEKYSQDALENFYQAAYKVMTLNPNDSKYAYSTALAIAVSKVGEDIDNLVANVIPTATTEPAKLDLTAYNSAIEEAASIVIDEQYDYDSRGEYAIIVADVNKDKFANQADVDATVVAIQSAKFVLRNAIINVTFDKLDEDGNEISSTPATYNYGEKVTFDAGTDRVLKWTISTKNGSVTTKLASAKQVVEMVATEDATVTVSTQNAPTTPVEQSKVTFVGKNEQVIAIAYVDKGDTKTPAQLKVEAPELAFYNFTGWSVSSITGTGEDITVRAKYAADLTDADKCTVHYNGEATTYNYDSYINLDVAEGTKLAMSKDGTEAGIITYLTGTVFFAPHTADIYIIEVATTQAKIGITGKYSKVNASTGDRTAAFNVKLYIPEDAELIEAGLIASAGSNKAVIKAESISKNNEYCIKLTLDAASTVTSINGQAYATYKQGAKTYTIYSTVENQTL